MRTRTKALEYHQRDIDFRKGIYKVQDSLLSLTFSDFAVAKHYNRKKENHPEDKSIPEYFYDVERVYSTTWLFKQKSCNGSTIFQGQKWFGSPDNEKKFHTLLKDIKNEGVWFKLNL